MTLKLDPEDALATILHWEAADNSNSFLRCRNRYVSSTLYYHDIFQ